jgi:hypothetical protein
MNKLTNFPSKNDCKLFEFLDGDIELDGGFVPRYPNEVPGDSGSSNSSSSGNASPISKLDKYERPEYKTVGFFDDQRIPPSVKAAVVGVPLVLAGVPIAIGGAYLANRKNQNNKR